MLDTGSSALLTGAVVASGNAGNGIALSAGSTLAMGGTSTLQPNGSRAGLQADDGASLRVAGAAFVGNGLKDLLLTFGACADFRTTSFGTYSRDATVLVRGTLGPRPRLPALTTCRAKRGA